MRATPSGARGRQDRRGTIDARVREPRLRRDHQAARDFGAALVRQLAEDEWRVSIPGEGDGFGREVGRSMEEQRGGQQRLIAKLAGVD